MCKIRKSLFLFLTAFCLLLAAVLPAFFHRMQAVVSAEETVIDGNTEEHADSFTISNGTLTAFSTSLTVPYGVIIPDGVTAIAEGVFENNGNLTGVALPEGLTEIGARAFAHTPLVKVSIPASVTEIGEEAFRDCAALSSVEFKESEAATGDPDLTIGARAFASCWSLYCAELPARCALVGSGAFAGCISLSWVYINSPVLTGSQNVFSDNAGLTVVFSERSDYEAARAANPLESYFSNATYLVTVEYYTQGATEPIITQKKLHGASFTFVRNTDEASREFGAWEEQSGETLPAQDESYVSTVWYQDEKLKTKADVDYLNRQLTDAENMPVRIMLWAHKTIAPPKTQKETSWTYGKHAFDVSDTSAMMTAVGAEEYDHVSAIVFTALAENGSIALTRLADQGAYLVTASLNPAYGVWKSPAVTQLTLGKDDARTMEITLVILAVFGLAAVVLTIALVLVRSRAGRKKRRELTSEEVIDKFIAAGGRTRLKK